MAQTAFQPSAFQNNAFQIEQAVVRVRGSIDGRAQWLANIRRDDEEIITLAALMVAALGDDNGRG